MTRDEFREKLSDRFGEPFTISYFDRSGFSAGDAPVLYPWSYVAESKFKHEAWTFIRGLGVRLGPPILEHLKNPRQRLAAQ